MTEPNFFIVGAAKSGTTALWYYLGQHPDCFVTPVKEPHRWAPDLGLTSDPFVARHPELFLPPNPHDFWSAPMRDVDDGLGGDPASYPSLFAHADGHHAVGEASPSSLLSREAARSMARAHPDARILIVLRHPVDVMHSLHAMLRLGSAEPCWDFAEAIEASRHRTLGDPPGHRVWTRYLDVVRFSEQVARFLDAFPTEQVHVSLFDDLRRDPAAWLTSIQRFLDLEPRLPEDMRPINDARTARSRPLQRALVSPRARLRAVVEAVPERLRVRAVRANLRPVTRDPMTPELRARLTATLADEVAELGARLGRDLSHWAHPS